LSLILHHYSQFSVSTIDAFFQRVIRSFTRETNLLGNFRLEVENDLVLEEVVDLVLDKLTHDEELRGWVLEFSLERLVEGKDWDIRSALLDFSNEIFKEEYKAIEEDIARITADKSFFKNLKQQLTAVVRSFESNVVKSARALLHEFQQQGLAIQDFKYGKSGSIYGYVASLEQEIKMPGVRVMGMLDNPSEWPSKTVNAPAIVAQASRSWSARLVQIVQYIETEGEAYYSSSQALRNLYVFGLLADISKTLREYLSENNLMLLSDAPQFLHRVMKDQDTSFVYEKVGSFYRHFLVDEFQDTSGFQWSNLLPLIRNGIAQNYKSMIVGDIKQSIYRWRGGDLKILQESVKTDVGEAMIDVFPLDTNYRSTGHVVSFNNALFTAAATLISRETDTTFPQQAYEDVAQKIFRAADKGYVSVRFLDTKEAQENAASGEDGKAEKITFEDLSLEQLPALIEQLQDKGVSLRDIAFLVRDNKEGQMIAQYFMQYRSSENAKANYKYDVVSNESLRLDQATSVLVLVNAMRLLEDRKNMIARAQLAFEYDKLWPHQAFPNHHKLFSESKTKEFRNQVPAPFTEQQDVLAAMPLVDLVENLVHIFRLGKLPTEIAYLQGFQDLVLEFAMREKSDRAAFLQWWDDNKHKKSIQVAGGVEAAQIITIHKSKGLQFKYVIIPFLTWELNHKGTKSPILWCHSDESFFKNVGYLPLRYTSTLENSYFKDYYLEERKRIYLDNLNLLYVAFTRAEFGLIALAPDSKSENRLSSVGALTKLAITSSEALNPYWSNIEKTLTIGAMETETVSVKPDASLVLKSYFVNPWKDKLQVKVQGKEFFRQTTQRKKINYGIFLHALMARIRTVADVDITLQQAVQEGMIQAYKRAAIEESIRWMMTHPALLPGFDGEGVLKRESSLVMPDGSERRIDRIVLKETEAFLIDYKTGAPTQRDREQLQEYKTILQSMGMPPVKGFLVYVNEQECREV
jgi:ATP-dependent exoDNAse (exonuclease V) beta subunit